MCEIQWYFDTGKGKCRKCKYVNTAPFKWGAATVAILALVIVPVLNAYFRELVSKFRQLWDDSFVYQAKVVWTAYQILGSTSYSIDYVPFPETFDNVASRFVSIALFNIGLPMNCLFDHYDDHTRLFVRTLGPIVVVILLGLVFQLKAWCCGLRERYIPSHTSIQLCSVILSLSQMLAAVRVLCHSSSLPHAPVHLEHPLCYVRLHRLR